MYNVILKILLLNLMLIKSVFAMEVAITIDDLPQHGNLPSNVTRLDVINKIHELPTFSPKIYFPLECKLQASCSERKRGREALYIL